VPEDVRAWHLGVRAALVQRENWARL